MEKKIASSISKITIDVYLLPDCCYKEVISNNSNSSNLIESSQQIEDCFLLERWSFIMLTKERYLEIFISLFKNSIINIELANRN